MYSFVKIIIGLLLCLYCLPGCQNATDGFPDIKVELLNNDMAYQRGRDMLHLSSRFFFSSEQDITMTDDRFLFAFDKTFDQKFKMLVNSMCIVDGRVSRQFKELDHNDSVMVSTLIPMEALLYQESPVARCDFHFELTDKDGKKKVFTAENLNININSKSEWRHFFQRKYVDSEATSYLIDGNRNLVGFDDFQDYTDVSVRCEDAYYTKAVYNPYESTLNDIMSEAKRPWRRENFVQNCQIALRQKNAPYNLAFTSYFLYNLGAPQLVVEKFDFVLDYLKEPTDLIKRPVYKAQIYNPSSVTLYASVANYNQNLHMEHILTFTGGQYVGDRYSRTDVAHKKLFAELSDGNFLLEDLVLDNSEKFIFKVLPKQRVFLDIYADIAKNCLDYTPLYYNPALTGKKTYNSPMDHYNAMVAQSSLWRSFVERFNPPTGGAIVFSFSQGFLGLNQVDDKQGTQVSYQLYSEDPDKFIRTLDRFNGYLLPHPHVYRRGFVQEEEFRDESKLYYPYGYCGTF